MNPDWRDLCEDQLEQLEQFVGSVLPAFSA
jgi:hypothetical protein